MKPLGILALGMCLLGIGCDDDNVTSVGGRPAVFSTVLTSQNEVPPPNSAQASGNGAVQVTFNVTRDSSGTITAANATFYMVIDDFPGDAVFSGAHIHRAAPGVNGPIVVDTRLGTTTTLAKTGTAAEFLTTVAADPATVQGIIDNPSGYYFNLHTTLHPGGVIRGQLQPVQ